LAGRRGATRTPWRLSLLGLLSVAAGLAAGAAGAARGELLLILPGLALCELGVVALTPGILSLAGRLAPRLPVAFRIALRDAARNRSAAVPALAAVLAVTTASIAIAIYVSSQSARDRLQYQPQLPAGLVLVRLPDDRPDAASLAVQALRANLDVSRVAVLSSNNCANCMDLQVVRPAANQCPPEATSRSDPRCQYQEATGYGFGGVVMEPELLGVLMDRLDPADVAALEAGKLLVGSALDLDESGQVTVVQRVYGEADPAPTRGLPAAVRRSSTRLGIAVLMSPATAAKLHVQTAPTAVVAALASPVTDQQEQSLVAALADNDLTATIEHGYVDRYRAAILATLLAAVIIAMGATALATALAVVDSRPDLLTLWAVGASPGLRRRLSVARAGVVALLGVLLGTALGFLPPIMVIDNARRSNHGYGSLPPDPHPLAIPWWPNVIGTVMLVPLAAMLIAGLMTRTRPPEPLRTDA
ncbi:FtsX-like permease family protein, partial [Jatrophihabitans sp.]|uniref:FtsX-like permease family protein n=1 Tax=Jatrophihabitans sp. TaxID=1932789 RepID=UPI002EEA008E